jgi:hypothetical protein
MLIDTPIRPLGFVDSRTLTEKVLAADESAWHADPRRQTDYEVHVELSISRPSASSGVGIWG